MTRPAFSLFARFTCLCLAALLCLSACSTMKEKGEAKYPTSENRQLSQDPYEKSTGIFGPGGLLGKGATDDSGSGGSGIGVNSYLWRASLDTVSFMPVASADPFGGTILTDWYSPPGKSNERYKLNVFILDRQLRSDGIQVKVFRQTAAKTGWRDAPVPAGMARQLEDTILTRARQLRVGQMETSK
jgi:hypothetical protein